MSSIPEAENENHMEVQQVDRLETANDPVSMNVDASNDEDCDKKDIEKNTTETKSRDQIEVGGDDKSENDSGEESVKSDESSFHPSDYENDAGYNPDKDPMDIVINATTLKEQGNAFFKDGDLVRASRSYKKGVSILKPINKENTGDDQVKSLIVTLSNNLSMVCLKQGKPKLSMDVAAKAIEIDESNAKAYYRRAMAHKKLGNFKEAKRDLKASVKIDTTNKAVVKELHALVKYTSETARKERAGAQAVFSFNNKTSVLYEDKLEAEKRKKEEEERKKKEEEERKKKRKKDWEDECVRRMAAGEDAMTYDNWDKDRVKKEKEAKKAKKQEARRLAKEDRERKRATREAAKKNFEKDSHADEDDEEDDDVLTESELAAFRGYKKTTDGKTTSYFTREQSQREKELIGDITPQRLESDSARNPVSQGSDNTTAQGKGKASAWNAGGATWEEKDATDWCTTQLEYRLKNAAVTEGSLTGVVTSIGELEGEASVAVAGGRKRYIFDYHCSKMNYEIHDKDVDQVLASGILKLPDINSGNHDSVEVEATSWTRKPSEEYIERATKCQKSLLTSVKDSVLKFVEDFNNHY